MQSELMTVKELADRLRISERQVWKLLAGERMPKPIRIGRSVRWPVATIDRWIEQLQAEGVGA